MDERTRLAALTVIGTTLLTVPTMYGVSRVPGPDGRLVLVIGGGPSLIAFGVIALILGLAWVTAPFVRVGAAALLRLALVAFALSLAIIAASLTVWWFHLADEQPALGPFRTWSTLILGTGAPLLFAIAGAKRLREALKSPAVKSPRPR
jgi:hypothetical protein